MKKCSKCSEIKPFEEFGKDPHRKDGRDHYCKPCGRIKNKERKNRLRTYLLNYLVDHPCIDCGETDPIVLEFDHIHGNKSYTVSELLSKAVALHRMETEVAKCVVRCANCHRRKTAKDFGYYRHLVSV